MVVQGNHSVLNNASHGDRSRIELTSVTHAARLLLRGDERVMKGELTATLGCRFDPAQNALQPLAQDVARCQYESTREVYENPNRKGMMFPDSQEMGTLLELPSTQ